MGRPKRVSQTGHLRCPRCDTIKFIDEFYQMKGSVYVIVRDVIYGKPMSWCKECMKTYQKGSRLGMKSPAELNAEAELIRLKKEEELAHVRVELAKQGLELGEERPDGSWTAIPIQNR